eukprot:UN06410
MYIFFYPSLSYVSLLFTRVYLGFCLHLIDFVDTIFPWIFFQSSMSGFTSLYLRVFGILFALN